ncbi:PRC-barrel domain containing protein [Paraflavitalea soli]|uniref:PRC-barrel domain containing protein n=1 Tax=Paraflavitalea soli TaxID=2315862 RepID=A0A3B7MIJ3_9BACT|nr:PRC-barrel domain-containing protein [Paraflavitalea soli]AXY72866.1 PRC-barrel domain containing protein [Paraflavitalea soli]
MATYDKQYEADNQTGINHEGPDANNPVKRLTARSITGDKVENPNGDDLGKIEDLMINIDTGEVEYVVMESGAFLGLGGKLFAIPFKELRLNPAKEVFVLNRDKEYLKESPGFDKDHWPDTNDHRYFERVTSYYDRTPIPMLPL